MAIGNEKCGRIVAKHLRDNLAAAARRVEAEHGHPEFLIRTPDTSPAPKGDVHLYAADSVALRRFPVIMILQADTEPRRTTRTHSIEGEYDLIEFRYRWQIVQQVQGDDGGQTERQRKLLLDVVRACFFPHKILWESEDQVEQAIFAPEGFREEFTGLAEIEKRLLLESITHIEVTTQERIWADHAPQEEAPVIEPSFGLEPHPALDGEPGQ